MYYDMYSVIRIENHNIVEDRAYKTMVHGVLYF